MTAIAAEPDHPRANAPMPFAVGVHALFCVDDTEFANDYRDGETTIGYHTTAAATIDLSPQARLTLGVYVNQRAGSANSYTLARPVATLAVGARSNQLLIGTLDTVRHGPSGYSLHGLVAPLQLESLAFTRAWEDGVQWRVQGERTDSDLWLNWQKLNTPEHREAFDVGWVGEQRVAGPLRLCGQFHSYHTGGQQYDVGAVGESYAGGPGVALAWEREREGARRALRVEGFWLFAKDRPDRQKPELTTSGRGVLLRASGQWHWFGAFATAWRGRDFITAEGDANYLARTRAGIRGGERRYEELGLSAQWRPAPSLFVELSARAHHVETTWEGSVRLTGEVDLELLRAAFGGDDERTPAPQLALR